MKPSPWLAFAGWLVAIGLHAAPTTAADHVHQLAGAPSRYSSTEGRDYRLTAIHPKDASGQLLTDIPSWRIDLNDAEGDWEEPNANLPALQPAIPAALRNQIALVHTNAVGWIIIPRGWRVQRAIVGEDGNAIFNFIAPTGAADGWLTLEEIPACLGCMYRAAEGIFPDAHKQLDGLLGTSTPKPTLSPQPDSLSHPDRCTARLTYQPSKSPTVQAVMVLDQQGDPSLAAMYAALPASQTALTQFLITRYRSTQPSCAAH
ncbi:DUF4850 domain-containing protein [Dyella silvatica]|uniref:DUF4850 domain-containing protein n=1 Tax=Dyella silvatica TaxID=2992128 RepID=UPI0022558E65|nr:DUF4850 domain-containing protein [Dyella silvatica]